MADAIWNDRFILSNMTSEKLYAKSPLTTGVSGTSAYIGLEPSATYNETVLWESTGTQISTGGYIQLNESPFNFNYVRLDYAHQKGWGGKHSELIPDLGKSNSGNFVISENWFRAAAGYNNMWHNMSFETFNSANNRIYHNSGFQGIVNNTAWNTNGDLPITYYKVVGINRKEV